MLKFRRFFRDARANTGMLFAMAALPLMGAVGMGVDYSLAQKVMTNGQNAVDAGLLSAAARVTSDPAAIRGQLASALAGQDATIRSVTMAASTDASGNPVYVAEAIVDLRTPFLGLIKQETWPIKLRSEATGQKKIVTATFKPISAKGAFAKDIFFWTRDAGGAITLQQNVIDYRYGVSGSGTTPPSGSATYSFSVPDYATFGVGMVVYQDLGLAGAMINPVTLYSDVNASNVQQTGLCSDPGGAQFNMEDGGDGDYLDFVYNMTCTLGVAPNASVRLSR